MNRPVLCFLTVDSVSEGVGRSQIIPVLREVALRGWDVRLVAFDKTMGAKSRPRTEQLRGVGEYTAVPFGRGGPTSGAWRVARLTRALPRADVYHCRSDLPYLAAALSGRRPRVWDCRSLWAEQRVAAGSLSRSSPTFLALKQVERRACQGADGLVTLSHNAEEVLLNRWGRLPRHRQVIPTVTDLSHFSPRELPDVGYLRAGLSGTFGPNYDPDLALDFLLALQDISDSPKNLEALWTTGREGRVASGEKWPIRSLHRTTDYDELPEVVASCHFGMVPIRLDTGLSASAMMPTKVGEFLASGRPVVVTRGVGDLDDIVTRHRVGVILHSRDEGELRRGAADLLGLLREPDVTRRCREAAQMYFSLTSGAEKLVSLYQSVL